MRCALPVNAGSRSSPAWISRPPSRPSCCATRSAALIRDGDTLLEMMLRRDLRQTYRKEVGNRLAEIFAGQDLTGVRERLAEIQRQVRSARLFVALHMHAGDGNIHTNIPVHSANYQMLQEADRLVDRIMAIAERLDGVISGEHGIGLTKVLSGAREARRLRRVQNAGRSARALQSRQAAARLGA